MQFSVRTLMLFTTLCAVAAWLGSTWNRAQRQKRLVALLREDGDPHVEIVYDFQREYRYRRLPPHVPKPLINALGVDCFASVIGFESRARPRAPELNGAALLVKLSDFPALERLSLFVCVSSDGELALLRRHDRLRDLKLWFSNVDGTGLQGMSCRAGLRTLSLRGCPVSDEGLEVISTLESLEELDVAIGNGILFEPQYSHRGLAQLAKLKRLKRLQVAGLDATDADLAAIAGIRSLEQLEFYSFPFKSATGAGIRQLGKLTELRSLRLHHDLETTIPRGKLPLVLDALAEAQNAKDRRVFRAETEWEPPAVKVE
jgi:hypothetical protein